MKHSRLVAVVVGLLFLNGVLAGNASATPIVACQSQQTTLRQYTLAAKPSFTNQEDLTRSLATLDAVWPWLAGGKNPVAVQNLTDFQTNLNALATAPQPKIDPAAAQRLTELAQRVIDCVNSLP